MTDLNAMAIAVLVKLVRQEAFGRTLYAMGLQAGLTSAERELLSLLDGLIPDEPR